MIKLVSDIMGYEILILLGIMTLVGVVIAAYIWSLIIDFLRGRRKWELKMVYMIFI